MGIINIFVSTNSRPGASSVSGRFNNKDSGKERLRITPLSHLFMTLLIKMNFRQSSMPRKVVLVRSEGANVRCLDCGWKYNFHTTTQCPICSSDKTYLLSNGSFFASVATIVITIAAFSSLIVVAYNAITT
jgi:Zn finger protein HypA/HybF involved in hydrogenase expression